MSTDPNVIEQAIADHINGGTYAISFTAERVPVVTKSLKEVKGVEVVLAYEDRESTRDSRKARNITHTIRVAVMNEAFKEITNAVVDPLKKLVADIDARLMATATAVLTISGQRFVATSLAYENGFYDREALRDQRTFVSEFTIEYLATGVEG